MAALESQLSLGVEPLSDCPLYSRQTKKKKEKEEEEEGIRHLGTVEIFHQ